MIDFQLQGINHIALVCKDMARTVDFYTNTLGLKLIKTIALPDGGQHFFFDVGNGDAIAFFWFPQAPAAAPGIASVNPEGLQNGNFTTAHASMNHLAFNVPLEKLEEYREKLAAKGVTATPVLHHADVPSGFVNELDENTFISSFYFFDPDGILLEFAANVRTLGDLARDVSHMPAIVNSN
ncbi:glyoxalase [Chroococcidiopsis sp. CCALA 051]|uniref:VOC family protein n=1 Tax=Chroococcidiopsis sp. CCALA 051 TaxID=869949 RepID=UPI000D0CED8F|nr:VOC family protein [Chroococcidiopsis sp. CCALA 051]MBE9017036.1 VOC family protein [Chroococcidiopsidales cyanobacterium LEGE 13417]PSM46371.1 glyoxalase [Chroococcidiopsis sp. CCALA 051]